MDHRIRSTVLAVVAGALVGVAAAVPAAADTRANAAPATAPARRVVPAGGEWRDDFSGRAGRAANTRYWTYQTGGQGWGNEELQRYTSGAANAALDGQGHLIITARPDTSGAACWYGPCRYTSARLTTSGKVTAGFGRIEARMKLPSGAGLWPAFWMLGANYPQVGHPRCGEIDVMELVGTEPSRVWASAHGPGYLGLSTFFDLPDGATFADDFHVFAVDRTPGSMVFSVDGVPYHTVTTADVPDHEWVFDQPFSVILNLAVGGRWPGEPTAETALPASMVVDYVAFTPAG